jgi:uncharacterized membrane protein YphA (DoxX/SURF4 family)
MNPLWKRRLLTGLCWLLAVEFTVGAATKFYPGETFFGPPYSVKFVDWGYPSWFRFVVGAGELLAAALLVIPQRRSRFMGAATLVVILAGAVITHIANQDPLAESASAPVHLAITGALAWASRPADWRELWTPRRNGRPGSVHGRNMASVKP